MSSQKRGRYLQLRVLSVAIASAWILGLFMLLLPASAAAYKVKTTVANLDWDPREESEETAEFLPIRWFEPEIHYSISRVSLEGLNSEKFASIVNEAVQIWQETLGGVDAVDQGQSCVPELIYDGPSKNTSGVHGTVPDGENTVYFIQDPSVWADRGYDPKSLAMTNISFNANTGQILEADIEINGAAFNFVTPPESIEGETRRLGYTVEHELGHLIGIGHSEVQTSLMYATTTDDTLAFPLDLDNDDVEGACFLYRDVEVPVTKEATEASAGGCNSGPGSFPLANTALALLLALCGMVGLRREKA